MIKVRATGVWSFMVVLLLACCPALSEPQAGGEIVLEKGTKIYLHLNDHLSTKLNRDGDVFTAEVVVPVFFKGRLVIPKGSIVTGYVSRVQRPGRFRGKAMMNLVFDSIQTPGGKAVSLVASLLQVNPDGKAAVGTEGTVTGEGSAGKDAATVAKPGLAGAGIGAIAGGGKGAAIGTGIGAVAGLATVFATRGKDLELRRGSSMEIVLDRPLTLLPDTSSPPHRPR